MRPLHLAPARLALFATLLFLTTCPVAGAVSPPKFSFITRSYSVSETGSVLKVIVRRSPSAAENRVDLQVSGGTALAGEDYTGETNVNLVFAPGERAKTNTFVLTDDLLPEGDETIHLQLANPSEGTLLGPITNTSVKLRDNESAIQFTSISYTNKERSRFALISVERSGPLDQQLTVEYSTVPPPEETEADWAMEQADYFPTNGVVTFPKRVRLRSFRIPVVNDKLVEPLERLDVLLTNPSTNTALGGRTAAPLFIADDDRGGVIQFSAATVNVKEGRGLVYAIVTRSAGLASNVTVQISTSDGSADAGSDYESLNDHLGYFPIPRLVSFGANETRKYVPITIWNDSARESTESFYVSLSSPRGGATLGLREAMTVRIVDDEPPPPPGSRVSGYASCDRWTIQIQGEFRTFSFEWFGQSSSYTISGGYTFRATFFSQGGCLSVATVTVCGGVLDRCETVQLYGPF